jgi:metal-sulfur cluster biosynthetic enzyme
MTVKMPVIRVPDLQKSIDALDVSRVSGGRDKWSEPLTWVPEDPSSAVWDCLREVLDPEIPISLVDLGLIYGVAVEKGVAQIDLTFTATACPCMEFIRDDLTDRLLGESWIREVKVHDVWDPPWTNEMITPEGRAQLRTLGVGVAP